MLSIVSEQLNHVSFSQPEKFFHPSIHKDAVPSIQQSMVVYEYVCRCDCRYVGRTSLRFEERIKQHVSNFVRRKQQPTKILPERKCKIRSIATHQQCGSAIGLRLMQNPECALQYSNDQFSILAKARSMFHLSILEATYIKIRKPILCRQKEFVYSLQIFFTNSDVAGQQWQRYTLVGARTTFEFQPTSIHYYSPRIRFF